MAGFDESKHPRDKTGEFTSKGGGEFRQNTKYAEIIKADEAGLTSVGNNDTIKRQRAKLVALKGKPEGTYDLETGEPVSYESGFQVSFQQTSDSYTDDEFDAKVEEMIKRTGSIAHGGVYGGEAEVSFHTDSIQEALAIAAEYNQESILDWAAAFRDDWDNAFILNTKYNAETNKTNKELKK